MAGPNTSTRYTHVSNLDVGGDVVVGDDLTVTDDVTVGGNLDVTGTLSSGAYSPSTIDASGDIRAGDDFISPGLTGDAVKLGTLASNDYGWHDIMGQIDTRGVGATDPSWTQVGATAFYAHAFALNDECWINYHIPHDYVPGTDVHFHVHWMPSGTDGNDVKWQFTYMYADGHDQGNFNPTGTTVTATGSPTTQYQHMVTETAGVTISGMEVDGIIAMHIKRVTNGATDNADTIFVLTADIHYQSTGLPTANRAPNFYNT